MKQHSTTIVLIQNDSLTVYLIRDYFDLPRNEALMSSLLTRRLGQADLVLALLHLRDHATRDWRNVLLHYIRRLVGRPITVGTPCLIKYRGNTPYTTISYRDPSPRIIYVTPGNPRQLNTDAYRRWADFRVGRTLNQLRIRGHKKRDIRNAIQRNWIRVTD